MDQKREIGEKGGGPKTSVLESVRRSRFSKVPRKKQRDEGLMKGAVNLKKMEGNFKTKVKSRKQALVIED